MADWLKKFSKKEHRAENAEDFILFEETDPRTPDSATENETPQTTEAEKTDAFSETARFEIPENTMSAKGKKRGDACRAFCQKNKKVLLGTGISLGAVALLTALALLLTIVLDPLYGYTQLVTAKGNVIPSLDVQGTLTPNAQYSITSLVAGTVQESLPETGETVQAGQVLYRLDDSEAQLAVKQAENQLEKAKAVSSGSTASLRIYATEAGTVQTLHLTSGSFVSAGQIVATLMRSDDTVVSITSTVSGTVSSVNVRKGSSVSAGSLLATVKDTQSALLQASNIYDQKSSEYALEAAKAHLQNYIIRAPISGIITQKNAKVGDNIAIGNTREPMMVIMDTNSMKFTFPVDEDTLSKMEVGQRAFVKTDSVSGKTFSGKVSAIASEGYRNDEDTLLFDITATVENPGELKVGMRVEAKIILDSATNVISLPEKALLKPDGKNALVLVKGAGENALPKASAAVPVRTTSAANATAAPSSEEDPLAGINIPKGCHLVRIRYGISDGTNVAVLTGLKLGDVVVYKEKWEVPDLAPAPVETETPDFLSTPDTTPLPDASTAPESTIPEVDEDLKQQILERIEQMQTEENQTEHLPL